MNFPSFTVEVKLRSFTEIFYALHDEALRDNEEDLDKWIENQEFANKFRSLFDVLPICWLEELADLFPRTRRHVLSPMRETRILKKTRNRAILNFRNNLPVEKLKPETIESIWKWADDPASFFKENDRTANPLPEAGALLTPLDSVCILLDHLETRVQLDRIRRRLLLYLLAWMVETRIQVGTHDDVASMLVQSHLISPVSQKSFAGNLRDWLARGRQYLHLAKRLGEEGEAGAVIFLPMWKGESVWYHHSHVGGGNGAEIIAWLRASKVTEDARRTHEYRNVDGVVKTLSANEVVERLRAALDGNLLVRHEMVSPSPPMPPGSRIRSSRQLPSPVIPSSPPTLGQQGGQELLPRQAMTLSQSSPDAGSCTLGEPSPSVIVPREDDCRNLGFLTGQPRCGSDPI
ncbi:uncharacterized protein N7473_013192 [Penicillium subrubescens]|uniref:uncharacterized protein n=1 Tax=Penicillium subrubescens TaxID=1316194 RepID=UPI00254563B2|nr:uncharacterized protein N7473_013192 [Penicillium subrubescens]KAJ5873633.1 hypothetical protein N7473_013192 [Penicillium subrubescens]